MAVLSKERIAEIFKALPHVETIWVTTDGHFHLHDAKGGERIDRNPAIDIEEEKELVDNTDSQQAQAEIDHVKSLTTPDEIELFITGKREEVFQAGKGRIDELKKTQSGSKPKK